MAKAARLLRYVVQPIKTIAHDCGYSFVSNFCRDFKRVHGISPMQMRLHHIDLQARAKLLPFSNVISDQSDATG